ncbi:hypothetical protein AVEN_183213-1, partial [Araneus ventricosus]
IRVHSISGKGNNHLVIVKLSNANALECCVMVSSSCMILPTLFANLMNCCESSSGKSGVSTPPPYSPDSAPNLGSRNLSGTRFSSESDVKTVVENWLNGQDVISAKPG